ncbi:MAG: hypothetical protein HC866_01645 [Leptolyngbyaceae cyanobacterium RU_5_1]|nr:hypothetical protein [Leptolyngbyaceae cyanobacterium RU_5_1]
MEQDNSTTDEQNGNYDLATAMSAISPKAGSLSVILRTYKSAVSRWCKFNGYPFFAWQSRFYEQIIRTDEALNRIRQYTINNPVNWNEDQNNTDEEIHYFLP